MSEYPVYYQGREVCKWNPLHGELWDSISRHLSKRYEYRSDYLCFLEKDKVVIVLKTAGEGG